MDKPLVVQLRDEAKRLSGDDVTAAGALCAVAAVTLAWEAGIPLEAVKASIEVMYRELDVTGGGKAADEAS